MSSKNVRIGGKNKNFDMRIYIEVKFCCFVHIAGLPLFGSDRWVCLLTKTSYLES